jgi:hypothetical protein
MIKVYMYTYNVIIVIQLVTQCTFCGRDSYVSWIYNYIYNHNWSYEFESCSRRGVPDTTLCDKVCLWLATYLWFSPVSSTSKIDHHDITEILLKVALNSITLTLNITPPLTILYLILLYRKRRILEILSDNIE